MFPWLRQSGKRRETLCLQGSPQKFVKAYGTLHDNILISTSVERSASSVVSSALSGTALVMFSPCTPLGEVNPGELAAEKYIVTCCSQKFIKPKSFLLGNPLLAQHSSEAFQLLNHLVPHWSCALHVVLCITHAYADFLRTYHARTTRSATYIKRSAKINAYGS